MVEDSDKAAAQLYEASDGSYDLLWCPACGTNDVAGKTYCCNACYRVIPRDFQHRGIARAERKTLYDLNGLGPLNGDLGIAPYETREGYLKWCPGCHVPMPQSMIALGCVDCARSLFKSDDPVARGVREGRKQFFERGTFRRRPEKTEGRPAAAPASLSEGGPADCTCGGHVRFGKVFRELYCPAWGHEVREAAAKASEGESAPPVCPKCHRRHGAGDEQCGPPGPEVASHGVQGPPREATPQLLDLAHKLFATNPQVLSAIAKAFDGVQPRRLGMPPDSSASWRPTPAQLLRAWEVENALREEALARAKAIVDLSPDFWLK